MGFQSNFKGQEVVDLLNQVKNGGGSGQKDLLTEVTYAELVNLRNSAKLVPGAKYRIIDYETLVDEEHWHFKSANHPFDLVVTAIDTDALDERASALHSERDVDGYFAWSELEKWQIWYSIDNDVQRFQTAKAGGKYIIVRDGYDRYAFLAGTLSYKGNTYYKWVSVENSNNNTLKPRYVILLTESDSPEIGSQAFVPLSEEDGGDYYFEVRGVESVEGGKGVIYRLIDEFNNDAPYDFKNVLTLRFLLENGHLEGCLPTMDANPVGNEVWLYTFSFLCLGNNMDNPFLDFSLSGRSFNNTLEVGSFDNVFVVTMDGQIHDNYLGAGCYLNTFGGARDCEYITSVRFETNCQNNIFLGGVSGVIFGEGCQWNYVDDQWYDIKMGYFCDGNRFVTEYVNTGDTYPTIELGNYSSENSFGSIASDLKLGCNCHGNSFGVGCGGEVGSGSCENSIEGNSLVVMGEYCSGNTIEKNNNVFFGAFCQNNTIGERSAVFFGDGCRGNNISENCLYVTLSDAVDNCSLPAYFSHSKVGPNISGINIICNDTVSDSMGINYYDISGVMAPSSASAALEVEVNASELTSAAFTKYIRTNSNGEIVQYTVDDIINQ
jgi:hypothetical protein